MAVVVGILGEARGGDIWLTALWFEGRILKKGEEGGRAGGGICCEVRLEVVLEVRRGEEAKGRGEGGTLFRSGAMIDCGLNEFVKEEVLASSHKSTSM